MASISQTEDLTTALGPEALRRTEEELMKGEAHHTADWRPCGKGARESSVGEALIPNRSDLVDNEIGGGVLDAFWDGIKNTFPEEEVPADNDSRSSRGRSRSMSDDVFELHTAH